MSLSEKARDLDRKERALRQERLRNEVDMTSEVQRMVSEQVECIRREVCNVRT